MQCIQRELETALQNVKLQASNIADITKERDEALRRASKCEEMIEELSGKHISSSRKLHAALEELKLTHTMANKLENSKEMTLYYTGLSSFELLKHLYSALEPALHNDPRFKISLFEQFILTLMKLRLNLGNRDLGYRFKLSKDTVRRYIEKFIIVMHVRLPAALLVWPEKEALMKTMPIPFRTHYPNCVSIIDCFEINCEMHSNMIDKSSCYSQYKSHHTTKYLVSMTPQGSINFVSQGFGGRSTDVQIVTDSGYVKNIVSGNQVMGDRGFLIKDAIEARGAELITPSFKGKRSQLEGHETETSRIIANERIHIERVIGNLRKKFTILRGPIKIKQMCSDSNNIAFVDKIVVVCCCLMNAMPTIVPPW